MSLDSDGALLVPGLFDAGRVEDLRTIIARLMAEVADDRPGLRFGSTPGLAKLLTPATAHAKAVLGRKAKPVRATAFDKSPERNWALGWHQDRSIAVKARVEVAGFSRWTHKAGIHYVEPPVAYLERMLTVRIHLDPVDGDNGPVFIAPGSHLFGRIPERDLTSVIDRCGTTMCEAEAGDLWLYRTLILHASNRALTPKRRRVLQVMYSADDLPGGLEWLGV